MSLQLIVLCPDGHRVTVKMTKQTPLLSILEEACSKRKLDPTKHALRKENDRPHVPNLDTSLTVNFAGLPNHCKLEVVPCENKSIGQKVKIALQLEQGGRVIGEYSSDDTLDKVYEKAQEKLDGNVSQNSVPVIIYMRQELVGKESFAETSLKKLGLTGGSAVFRLVHRDSENLNLDQAGVCNMTEPEVKPEASTQESKWRPMRKEGDEANLKLFEQVKKQEKPSEIPTETRDETMEMDPTPHENIMVDNPEGKNEEDKDTNSTTTTEKVIEKEIPKEDAILNYLDEDHQTVIYKLSDRSAKIRSIIDVSDDFFDLTIEDAKVLLRDARKMQKELDPEEKTLMTKGMRQTQKEGKKLALMNKYKRSVIRVQLPDRHIIQAVFHPGADLSEVMDNLKRYLKIDEAEDLELFKTPPKTMLDLNQNLLDCELVPAALIYLTSKKSTSSIQLSNEIVDKLSNTTGAENALSEVGISKSVNGKNQNISTEEHIVPSQTVASSSTPPATNSDTSGTTAAVAATKRPPTTNLASNSGKVPRWFKPSKQ